MTATLVSGAIDPINHAHIRALVAQEGPCVSVFLPTSPRGKETLEGPVRLRNLLRDAEVALGELGVDAAEIDRVLDPLRSLADDAEFWQHQSEGLALYASSQGQHRFRVPITFAASVAAGPRFRIRPLWPLVGGADDIFFVLALSQNEVRLFEATDQAIGEIVTDAIPISMAAALTHEDREPQLQVRAGGGGTAHFHGHGAGDEIDKATLERYFRAVDAGVVAALGTTRRPIVLACVDYYVPIYRGVTKLPDVVDTAVAGNPQHRTPAELHAAALAVIEPRRASRRETSSDRLAQLFAAGKVLTDVEQIASASRAGRVDTILLRHPVGVGDDTEQEVLMDIAVADALERGGDITVVDDAIATELGAGPIVGAILRY